jgi:hypothetical protein
MNSEPKVIPIVNPTKEELENLDKFFEAYNGRRKIEPLAEQNTKEFYESYGQQRQPKHHNKKFTKRKPKGKKTHRK